MRRYSEMTDYELGYEAGKRLALRELNEQENSLPSWIITNPFYIICTGKVSETGKSTGRTYFASMRDDGNMLLIRDNEIKIIFGSLKNAQGYSKEEWVEALEKIGVRKENIHYCTW